MIVIYGGKHITIKICKVVHDVTPNVDINKLVHIGPGSLWAGNVITNKNTGGWNVVQKYASNIMKKSSIIDNIHLLENKILYCPCNGKICHGHILAYILHIKFSYSGNCVVCVEKVGMENQLTCSHYLCSMCLTQLNQDKCPSCRNR